MKLKAFSVLLVLKALISALISIEEISHVLIDMYLENLRYTIHQGVYREETR
jgi:hypothetical protein